MNLPQISGLINGIILNDSNANYVYKKGFASDLMSDVLRFHMEDTVLITGLSTIQTIRTAEISNITCVIVARGKEVTEDMLKLAKDCHISIINTKSSLFEISGILYSNGLKPVNI